MQDYFVQHRRQAALITAVIFLVLLVPALALMNFYHETEQSLTARETIKEQTLSDLAALALKIKLDKLVGIASAMASSPQLVASAKASQWTAAADVARDLQNDVNFYDPFIDRVIIYDTSATQQAAYPALTGGLDTNASSSAWYKALASGAQSSYVSNVTKRVSLPQIQVVNIAVPITSNKTIVGFLVMQIPTDNFLQFAGDVDLGTYGFGYIVDSVGNVIADPRLFTDSGDVISYTLIPEVQKVIAGESGTDIAANQGDGEKSVITYRPVATYGWGMVTQELYSEAFSTMSSILLRLDILILITILADILISYLVFKLLTSKKR